MFVETKEAGEVQVKPRLPKFSEAIRLGCKLAPKQLRNAGYFFEGAACVWGAAALGVMGRVGTEEEVNALAGRLHTFEYEREAEAFCDSHDITLLNANDTGTRTREQIADWLEAKGY